MSDYGKVSLKAKYSEDSEYTNLAWASNIDDYKTTPDEMIARKVEAACGGTAVNTNEFASASMFIVRNLDASNIVRVTYRTPANGATSNKVDIPPKGFMMLPEMTPSSNITLTAGGAASLGSWTVLCEVIIFGS